MLLGDNSSALCLLADRSAASARAGKADLVIIAPTLNQCRTDGWLKDALQQTADTLDQHGLAYALIPRSWRSTLKALIFQQSLSIAQELVHAPDPTRTRYLLSLNPKPVQYACSN